MSTAPPLDPPSLSDALAEASRLLDEAVSAALQVAGSGELRLPLEAIAREAEVLRIAAIRPGNGSDESLAHGNGAKQG